MAQDTNKIDRADGVATADRAGWGGEQRPALTAHGLRFLLVDELRNRGTMTVAEMVEMVAKHGFSIRGRASKVISDSLRWEQARGRVVRIARGVYRYGRAPVSTARRIGIFARQAKAWMTAVEQGQQPPPTPATPYYRKAHRVTVTENPQRPPWLFLDWLWST